MSNENFTPDEFDNPPAGPVGVHRGPKSAGARLMPYLVVMLIAAVCGLGVWTVASGALEGGRMPWQSDAAATSSAAATTQETTQTQSAEPSETASATSSATPSETASSASASATASETSASPSSSSASATASASPSATVDKSSSVLVLNGTGRTGYAAQQVSKLESSGYTNASASNPRNRSTLPDSSAVWYKSEADKATAQDVARQLGISTVTQVTSVSAPVVVVLMK